MSSFSDGSVVHIAANVATVLFIVTIILHLLLAAGILPISIGSYAVRFTSNRSGW